MVIVYQSSEVYLVKHAHRYVMLWFVVNIEFWAATRYCILCHIIRVTQSISHQAMIQTEHLMMIKAGRRMSWVMMTSSNGNIFRVMPQSHPTTGPARFLAPVRFIALRAVGILHRCRSRGYIRLNTAVHLWFDRIIRRTTHRPHAVPIWASYGSHMGISNVFYILRARAGPVRDPKGCCTTPLQTVYDI